MQSRLLTTLLSMTSSPPFKRIKLPIKGSSTKVIGTHSGTFQCDEALGCWLLRQTKVFRNSKVVRSRDPAVLEPLDIVIDVGGVYDHEKLLYDHHQRSFEERFEEGRVTKLSASGLVYRHYGKEVINELYPTLNVEQLEFAYIKMYDSFMEAIDAIDTGVEIADETRYRDSTGLSARIGRMNPRWNEEQSDAISDAKFEQASTLAGEGFVDVLSEIVESQIPAREIVEKAVLERMDVDSSGEIIKFSNGGLPWKKQVYELEKKHNVETLIKYVLYADQGGMWRIQCVSEEGKAFTNRLGLPEKWRGVRDEDLSAIAGIEGCTFCHASGFIGGNKTYEGVLKMAQAALAETSRE